MKHPIQRDETSRFQGSLRHYHRSVSQSNRTWDEWVDGKSTGRKPAVYWVKLIATIAAVLTLAAVVAGLFIELR
ncbi:MAG: hypothetical protein MUF13_04335 [Akkermansiaceae bacterium]|jgi:hypothetical protein|nr:hypothetical protein [Akkermansiaceae bacterium]